MSTVFKAMSELSVAAHRADAPGPRMVLEFPTYQAYQQFKQQMLADTHDLVKQPLMVDNPACKGRITYMGIDLVLSVRA